jgi:hypothetical protein
MTDWGKYFSLKNLTSMGINTIKRYRTEFYVGIENYWQFDRKIENVPKSQVYLK